MNSSHPTHKAEGLVDDLSGFAIWPFTENTGCPISDLHKPHMHDFYTVQYVTQGSGTHIVDFQQFDVTPHSLYFASPGQLHMWQPEGEISGYVMVFTEDFLRSPDSPVNSVFEFEFFHTLTHSPKLSTDREQAEGLERILDELNREFTDKNPGYSSVLRSFFHIFIVNLQRVFAEDLNREKTVRENKLVRQFKRLVAEQYASQMRIQEYADQLNISVNRLSSIVRDTTGQTPGQIIRKELTLAAQRMLANSDMNITEICFHLHFEDPSYFGRFFKRETGFSPSAFRNRIKEKYQMLAD